MPSTAQLVEEKVQNKSRTATAVPGPRINLLQFLLVGSPRDLLTVYMDAFREFGDVVRFQAGPFGSYFFAHPDHVKQVLQENNQNYCKKNMFNDLIKPLAGEGLLTSDGDLWRRRRRLAQPAFHRQRVAGFATLMTEATGSMLDRWRTYAEKEQPFDVAAEMRTLTLAIVGRALFSIDISGESDEMGQALNAVFEYFNHRSRHPLSLPPRIPTPRNRRFRQAIRALDKIAYGIIEERRREGTDRGDFLSMLLLAREEETSDGLTDKQLRDEVGTFLGAGHETTAVTLAWTWYLLSLHPQVRRRLQEELSEVLGERPPTFQDLPNLRYTRMVIEEVMRLYPAAWAMSRSAVGEDEVGGYRIPAKAIVVLSPYVTHRHPAFWDNPAGFDPERFTPERVAARPRYAYFPFGGGPRQCIGNEFALMEAQLIVAMVAQKYRLDLVPGHPVVPDPIFTLRPRDGVRVTLHGERR